MKKIKILSVFLGLIFANVSAQENFDHLIPASNKSVAANWFYNQFSNVRKDFLEKDTPNPIIGFVAVPIFGPSPTALFVIDDKKIHEYVIIHRYRTTEYPYKRKNDKILERRKILEIDSFRALNLLYGVVVFQSRMNKKDIAGKDGRINYFISNNEIGEIWSPEESDLKNMKELVKISYKVAESLNTDLEVVTFDKNLMDDILSLFTKISDEK
jgi:hypothetical protein